MQAQEGDILYIFLDESGNFDFSSKGTKYFMFGSISKRRPFAAYQALTELKYDLIEKGTEIEYFHASEDRQQVRSQVFKIISERLTGCRIDATIVEKSKTGLELRAADKFYAKILGYHLRHVIQSAHSDISEIVVITDRIPHAKKRQQIEKAVKMTLAELLKATSKRYRVLHHDSKSNLDLQIADYCCWAIYRKWEGNDDRSFQHIMPAVTTQLEFSDQAL